jgi:ribonuclease HII
MYSLGRSARYIIGVDEAGRGPIAGPVSIGAVMVPVDFDRAFFRDIKDSKRLTANSREKWFSRLRRAARGGDLSYQSALVSAQVIDRKGIVRAIRLAIARALGRLSIRSSECFVILDGSLSAPSRFANQLTIIGGDQSEPLIALASIVAKVRRDRRMINLGKRYPAYGFHEHKGYGTAAHYKALKKHGFCPIHRRSFLKVL